MILHCSIPARQPQLVATAVAELLGGSVVPFPIVPGAWLALADDADGTCIEVLPDTLGYRPGVGEVDLNAPPPAGPQPQPWEVQVGSCPAPGTTQSQHVALTTALSENAVHALAKRHGWRVLSCERGPAFRVTEVWLENRLLIEVATPADVARYRAFMRSSVCGRLFSAAPAAVGV